MWDAESDILQRLHHGNIVDVRATHHWPKKDILIIEEEFLSGGELLDATREAIGRHGFTMTESFVAHVRSATRLKLILCGCGFVIGRVRRSAAMASRSLSPSLPACALLLH